MTNAKLKLDFSQQQGLVALSLLAVPLLMAFLPANWYQLLTLTAAVFRQHSYWQLISAHFLHLNLWHLILNMCALVVWLCLFKPLLDWSLWLKILILALLISCLWALTAEDKSYVGLSAIVYALYLLAFLRHGFYLLASALVLLVLMQFYLGASQFEESLIGGEVAALAHCYAVMLVLIWQLGLWLYNKVLKTKFNLIN